MRDESYPGEADEVAAAEAACTPPPDVQAMTREQVIGDIRECVQMSSIPPNLAAPQDPNVYINQQRETIRRLEETINKADYRAIMDPPDGGDPSLLEKVQYLVDRLNHANVELAQLQARLTASEAKHKWTTARPTVAGWYWWRKLPDHKQEIVRLFLRNGFLCVDWGTKDADYLSPWAKDVGGEFQGPLTPGE